MRTLVLCLGVCLIVVVGCEQAQEPATTIAEEAQAVSFNVTGQPTVEIDVPGLHCENCSSTACELLAELPGVVDVKADSDTKKATVAVDESTFDSEAARAVLADQFGEATIIGDQAATEVEASDETDNS